LIHSPDAVIQSPGRDDGDVVDHGHQIAVSARLRPEHAEAVLSVVEGDTLDEASEHFLGRWFKIGLHTDRRIIRFVSWRYVSRAAPAANHRGGTTGGWRSMPSEN
jgi:hypothetical protein